MSEQEYIWVVDDDRAIRWVLEKALTRASMRIRCFDNADTALHSLEREVPDAIVSDIRMPGTDGFSLFCLLYTSPSPRDRTRSRMPSSA